MEAERINKKKKDALSKAPFKRRKPSEMAVIIREIQSGYIKALDAAHLKIEGLETMITIAEEELRVKIRKKSGTKQSIDSGKATRK